MSVDAADLVLTAMKKSEDGNGLLPRFCEWAEMQEERRLPRPGINGRANSEFDGGGHRS